MDIILLLLKKLKQILFSQHQAKRITSYIQLKICGILSNWTHEQEDYGKCNLALKVMSIVFRLF